MGIDIKLDSVLSSKESINKNNELKKSTQQQDAVKTSAPVIKEQEAGISKHVAQLSSVIEAESNTVNRNEHIATIKAQIDKNTYHVDLDVLADKLTHHILNK